MTESISTAWIPKDPDVGLFKESVLASVVTAAALGALYYYGAISVPPVLLSMVGYIAPFLSQPVAVILVAGLVSPLALVILAIPLGITQAIKMSFLNKRVVEYYMQAEVPSFAAIQWIAKNSGALLLLLEKPDADLAKVGSDKSTILKHLDLSNHPAKLDLSFDQVYIVYTNVLHHYLLKSNPHIDVLRFLMTSHDFSDFLRHAKDIDFNKFSSGEEKPQNLLGLALEKGFSFEFERIWNNCSNATKVHALLNHDLENRNDIKSCIQSLFEDGKISNDMFTESEQFQLFSKTRTTALFEKFLNLGFPINAKNDEGKTVLDIISTRFGDKILISLLKQKGAKSSSEL